MRELLYRKRYTDIRFEHVFRSSKDGDHDLVFLVNERPILVPGCNVQTGICKLSFIEDRFQRFVNANCAELFCSNN